MLPQEMFYTAAHMVKSALLTKTLCIIWKTLSRLLLSTSVLRHSESFAKHRLLNFSGYENPIKPISRYNQ